MRVIKPLSLGLLSRPFEFQRRFQLGFAVIAYVGLGGEQGLFAETAMWKALPEELPPDQPLDAAIPKTLGEFLVSGRAFAPGGAPARAVQVSVRLGDRSKRLFVAGDRHVEGDFPTQPQPFVQMPIDWSHAYGGPKHAENPLGRGMVEEPIEGVGFRIRVPNVLDPALPPQERDRSAAGFGPMDVMWPQRARFAGTYDDRWLKEDFPGYARDMDWRFFNVAPYDQHYPRPFAGDEEYALENLHPEQPMLVGRLPGLAPRLFLVRRDSEDGFEEVKLALTTVWFFPHLRRAALIHHGVAPIAEEDGRDVVNVVVGADLRGHPRPSEHYRDVMQQRLDPQKGALLALRDRDLVPAELIVPDPELTAQEEASASQGLVQKHARAKAEREMDASRAYLEGLGLDPDLHGPKKPPPAEPPPTLDELPERFDRMLVEADKIKAAAERSKADEEKALREILANSGAMTFEQLQAEYTQRPAGPPTFSAAKEVRDLENLRDRLRGMGVDTAEIDQYLAEGKMEKMWVAAEAGMREAYRRGAHEQDPAPRMREDWRVQGREVLARRSAWRRQNLCGADLSGLQLSGRDFTEAWLDAADMRGADLRGSSFARAVLAHADMTGCQLDSANLTGANLGRARLHGASLRGAVFTDAILAKADFSSASLAGARFDGSQMTDVDFSGLDLSGANFANTVLVKANLAGMAAAGACFDEAVLIECDLTGADLTGASLVSVTFVKCPAPGLRAARATLTKAVFADGCDLTGAGMAGALLSEANLRGVRLAGADLREAMLDGADLSDADLQGARLDHVRARGARFVVADLRGASLARGDFMDGMLTRADLRGTDLSDASFYQADLARVQTDRGTRADRMLQTRMRLNPRIRPA